MRALLLVNQSRLYKVLHYARLRLLVREESRYTRQLERKRYVWGGPEMTRWPPERWISSFAACNHEAFVKLWRYDVDHILSVAEEHAVPSILMTYHIQPRHLAIEEFAAMAAQHGATLVRNDEVFSATVREHPAEDYLLHDGWHPGPRGYEVIARNLLAVIEEHELISSP